MRRTALAVVVLTSLLASVPTASTLASTKSPIRSSEKPFTPEANLSAAERKAAAKKVVKKKKVAKKKRATKVAAARGRTGARGPRGFTGAKGAQGNPGPAGPAGAQGVPGATGGNGANGVNGGTGPQGDPGINGTNGTNGTNGANGQNGTNGTNGADGAPGTPGAIGPQGPQGPPAGQAATVGLRVLGINDFHGQLPLPTGSSSQIPIGTGPTGPSGPTGPVVNAVTGGANYLATHVKRLQQGRNSVLIGAGDLIGATPLVSGIFHDEPTIDVLNAMGMNFSGVGNHEFDEGSAELLRMQFGGCHPTDPNSCIGGQFTGAAFSYLAANVRKTDTDQTLLPPYKIKTVDGVPVAYIGLTLKDTPNVVTPAGVAGLTFDEEAASINRVVKDLSEERGVEAFVVAIHQGGQQNAPFSEGYVNRNKCENPTGDIFNIVPRISDKVDVVLSAHTHQQYICQQGSKLVTSSAAFGRLITTVDLALSTTTKDVVGKTATNELVTRDVVEDPAVKAINDKYTAASAPLANRIVGSTAGTINRVSTSGSGETPLGDLIADSQLAATDGADEGDSDIAFMNPGGIRTDLNAANSPFGLQVSYEELFNVQPFNNTLRVKTYTGAQIKALLEQQIFNNPGQRILQVSTGFTYSYTASAPAGSRVDASSIKLNGVTLNPTTSYRVTMNEFLASGGDGFTVFNQGTNQFFKPGFDIDAFEAFVTANSPVPTPAATRITRLP